MLSRIFKYASRFLSLLAVLMLMREEEGNGEKKREDVTEHIKKLLEKTEEDNLLPAWFTKPLKNDKILSVIISAVIYVSKLELSGGFPFFSHNLKKEDS